MASDNEKDVQDVHSIYNSRLKANPKEAKFFLDMVDKLCMQFDGMPMDDILHLFWGEPRDVLEKIIKRANKREKKVEATFDAKDLKRPPTANILHQRAYKLKCDELKTKFDLKGCAEVYKKLPEKEKTKYQKEAARLKVEYTAEYARLRADAIKTGAFPEDKPKRPLSAFLLYLADVREEIASKYKDVAERKGVNAQISKDAGVMWKELTDKERSKYEDIYKKEKAVFDIKYKEWEQNEMQRRKKQENAPEQPDIPKDIKIETTGTKKSEKVVAKTEPKVLANKQVSDSEEEPEAPKTKVKAKPVSKQSDSEEEQVVVKTKPKVVKAK